MVSFDRRYFCFDGVHVVLTTRVGSSYSLRADGARAGSPSPRGCVFDVSSSPAPPVSTEI